MRNIKILLCIILTVLILACQGCGFFGDQKYVCEIENVESIQIVRLAKYVEGEYRYEYEVLSEIEDKDEFVKRLNAIKHKVNWGEPSQLNVGNVAVLIDYLNGDYDLLCHNAQGFNLSGENHYGFFFFNQEQFDALVTDYT